MKITEMVRVGFALAWFTSSLGAQSQNIEVLIQRMSQVEKEAEANRAAIRELSSEVRHMRLELTYKFTEHNAILKSLKDRELPAIRSELEATSEWMKWLFWGFVSGGAVLGGPKAVEAFRRRVNEG